MGFNYKRTYVLDFSGTELEEAEIKMRSTSVGKVLDFQTNAKSVEEEAAVLAEHIIEWNLEDDKGKPLAVTVESLLSLEPVFYKEIGKQWINAVRGVSVPLGRNSNSGDQSQEQPDQTEAQ